MSILNSIDLKLFSPFLVFEDKLLPRSEFLLQFLNFEIELINLK